MTNRTADPFGKPRFGLHGYRVSGDFTEIAEEKNPQLPNPLRKLSWLDLESDEGQQYWQLMNLMGRYASAGHEVMHNASCASRPVELKQERPLCDRMPK